MGRPSISRNRLRQLLLLIALGITLAVLIQQLAQLTKTGLLPIADYMAYWAAGRLNVTGGNPYAPDQLLYQQKGAGLSRNEPIMMWNPPWVLPLFMIFGTLSYPASRALWLLFHVALVLFCSDWIWRFYGGPLRHRWLAYLASFTFFPTLYVLYLGQISPLILLGVVGFLHFEKEQKGWMAGVCAVLVAIKPHLLYLFWIALLLWAIKRRQWPVLLGLGLGVLAATIIPLATNPSVINQYLHPAATQPRLYWATFYFYWLTPTIGTALRELFGLKNSWLQFVPLLMGILWFGFYWRRQRRGWKWGEQMPLLLLVSLVTTPYTWLYDEVILLIAILQIAVWLMQRGWRWTMLLYVLINGLALALPDLLVFLPRDLPRLGQIWYAWMAPSLLVWYLIVRRQIGRKGAATLPS